MDKKLPGVYAAKKKITPFITVLLSLSEKSI